MEQTLLLSIYFFTAWLLYLVVQAVFINGIKLSAAGSTEIRPDGTDQDSDMLLYPVAKFLLQNTSCKIFYSGEALKGLYDHLVVNMPVLAGADVAGTNLFYTSDAQRQQFDTALPSLNRFLPEGCLVDNHSFNGLSFYKTYDVYRFPAFVRKPVIQCVVCMGSFYGLFTFLIPLLVYTHYNLIVFPAYVINTVLLACVNKIIFKKV